MMTLFLLGKDVLKVLLQFLDGESILALSMTNKDFRRLLVEGGVRDAFKGALPQKLKDKVSFWEKKSKFDQTFVCFLFVRNMPIHIDGVWSFDGTVPSNGAGDEVHAFYEGHLRFCNETQELIGNGVLKTQVRDIVSGLCVFCAPLLMVDFVEYLVA